MPARAPRFTRSRQARRTPATGTFTWAEHPISTRAKREAEKRDAMATRPDLWHPPEESPTGEILPWHKAISEAGFQRMVVARAEFHGWWTWHCFDSRRTTPGLPDLILIKQGADGVPGRVIFAELKAQKGRLRPEQKDVLGMLATCPVESYVWRPSQWPEIDEILSRG